MNDEKLKVAISEAWTIINVLHMEVMDKGESWPRALEWLLEYQEYANPPRARVEERRIEAP